VAGDPVLELRITAKRFHAAAILGDVSFAAGAGEVLALFGPSGAGKSTTLRIAIGLDADFQGQVRRGAGRMGVLFQEPRLLPWLTLEENLRLVWQAGMPPLDVPALLESVGLGGQAALRPGALSLGMARRAALARALAVDPALLVLDEPFASLDPGRAALIAGCLRARADRAGTAILFATHELPRALACADRLLVLSGSPAHLAADLAVPRDAALRGAVAETLQARFPFLSATG
jgi:NitT/TauT family transport system ATP-binding protein